MADVILKNVYKYYPGNSEPTVIDFNLEIKDKEFVVFVGPSGCGKSTTLRMVAGLEEISSGEVYIESRLVNDIEPKDRDIAMVFQNYALYPHMTVYDNMAFGLKLKKIPYTAFAIDRKKIRSLTKELKLTIKNDPENQEKIKQLQEEISYLKQNKVEVIKYRKHTRQEIDDKVMEAASILEIEDYLERKPKNLSGGQRQRVAIGRAIVRKPKVFLMDEPLSNLDAKLRNQMRAELILLRKKINTTFIYVTHDQVEAMTLGDRIVVMKDGVVQQVGTPTEVFNSPKNKFVASFIGTPQMNFLDGKLIIKDGHYFVNVFGVDVKLNSRLSSRLKEKNVIEEKEVYVGIRPDHFKLGLEDKETFKGNILVSEMMGTEYHLHLNVNDTKLAVKVPLIGLDGELLSQIASGGEISFSFENDYIYLFDKESEESLEN